MNIEHARDIADRDFLGTVRRVGFYEDGTGWACAGTVADALDAPYKVTIAKARRLLGRGLLTGCGCGCRGDWVLTGAGLAVLDTAAQTSG